MLLEANAWQLVFVSLVGLTVLWVAFPLTALFTFQHAERLRRVAMALFVGLPALLTSALVFGALAVSFAEVRPFFDLLMVVACVFLFFYAGIAHSVDALSRKRLARSVKAT